jgi:peptidoglycan/LPS O-acetylase OafA/YrhL
VSITFHFFINKVLVVFGIFRFVLALNVMIFHGLDVPAIGPYAVYSFFILSGFLMTTIMHETYGYTISGFKRFVINRFLRIFPIYWVLLLIILIIIFIVGEEFSSSYHSKMVIPRELGQWLSNIFLVYPDFNPVEYTVRISPPSWALSIELFFYLLIGLGITRGRKVSAIVCIVSVCFIISTIISSGGIGYGSIFEAALPFALGGFIFHCRNQFTSLVSASNLYSVLSISLVLLLFNLAFSIYLSDMVSSLVFSVPKWKIGTICTLLNIIITCFVVMCLFNVKTEMLLLNKIDRLLGDLSYPLYIFHTAAACLSFWLLSEQAELVFEQNTFLFFVFSLILTIVVSVVCNELVNGKVEAIRRKIKRT